MDWGIRYFSFVVGAAVFLMGLELSGVLINTLMFASIFPLGFTLLGFPTKEGNHGQNKIESDCPTDVAHKIG